jgi:5-carboxyvanillate decarboxylase
VRRLDYARTGIRATVSAKRYPFLKPLKKQISDYMKENIFVTNSGMGWAPAVQFCQQVLGMDRVLYAMDYPYQFTPEEVKVMENSGLSALDQKKFYQTNAEAVFSL